MITVLSSDAMRLADELAVTRARIPSIELMESAGTRLLETIEARFAPLAGKRISIICGSGNNGGDGFVLARLLVERHARIRVICVGGPARTSDAATNFRRLEKLAARYADSIVIIEYAEQKDSLFNDPEPDLIVDAHLGTGLSSDLRPDAIKVVQQINQSGAPTVAVDIPTGIDADTGRVLGAAVNAAITVTMAAPKLGLILAEGPAHSGEVLTADIGIPPAIIDEAGARKGMARLFDEEDFRASLPVRPNDAHKYSAGMLGIVGGSAGLSGAVCLAAQAAGRVGAGAVVCAVPDSVEPIVANAVVEAMTISLRDGESGTDPGSVSDVVKRFAKAETLLVGPGIGRGPQTLKFVSGLLEAWEGTVVIDADGLFALSKSLDSIARPAESTWIVTPHAGEFMRFGFSGTNRIEEAVEFARENNVFVVLKGAPTVVATPDSDVYLHPLTTSAFATAGSGDVLSGMIAGFSSQGLLPEKAIMCALYAGSLAVQNYCKTRNPISMVASDIVNELPAALVNA